MKFSRVYWFINKDVSVLETVQRVSRNTSVKYNEETTNELLCATA